MNYDFTTNQGQEVTCELKINIYRDGIGPYEFWGQKCYDEGDVDVEWILKAVYVNGDKFTEGLFFDEIEEQLQDKDEDIKEEALEESRSNWEAEHD